MRLRSTGLPRSSFQARIESMASLVSWSTRSFPGTPEWPNGTSRPGDNLYTDSLVALELSADEKAALDKSAAAVREVLEAARKL